MNPSGSLANIFSQLRSDKIGQAIEDLVSQAITQRQRHERRWYDNNSFDDGYHFKVISRKTGRVIDHASKLSGYVERAIPRASLQIRGVSNLLYSTDPYPVVYPQRITVEYFRNPMTGEIDGVAYTQAVEKSKQVARKQGIWLTTEWEDQNLDIKLIDMMLLAAKNAVSYAQIYSDVQKQKICIDVYDAFDIILQGDKRELSQVPMITKAVPMDLKEVMNNPLFEQKMVSKLNPDNRYATSEIKEAYMNMRYGTKNGEKGQSTIIVKETEMKEYLTADNWQEAVKKSSHNGAMDGKSKGDMIMRHVFSAGGVTLLDEYVDYDDYSYVDLRFEPGPLYQTPFIERFIPQNKSLDIIVTRLEKWVNAMIVGVYQKRKGENFQISNFPGGQVVEYETTPLTQMNNASVGATPFQVIQLLDKYIEEQGASTSALNQLPSGVRSGNAIESLKASEYANLKIATKMLKKTIKTIAERMLERAHKDYLEPKEVEYMDDSEPDYFDVIGQRGYDLSMQVNKEIPQDVVPISKDVKVRIEIEPGLGLTTEGKRLAMKDIIGFITPFVETGAINKEGLKIALKKTMETYGFGSTQEFMEAFEMGADQSEMDEESIMKMKVAILETLKESGAIGPEMEKRLVDSTKVGVLEAMKDSGMLDKKEPVQPQNKVSISYKDLPPDGKVQAAQTAGIAINPGEVLVQEKKEKVLKQKNESTKKQI